MPQKAVSNLKPGTIDRTHYFQILHCCFEECDKSLSFALLSINKINMALGTTLIPRRKTAAVQKRLTGFDATMLTQVKLRPM